MSSRYKRKDLNDVAVGFGMEDELLEGLDKFFRGKDRTVVGIVLRQENVLIKPATNAPKPNEKRGAYHASAPRTEEGKQKSKAAGA